MSRRRRKRVEQRDSWDRLVADIGGTGYSSAGIAVSHGAAEGLATVGSCVQAISSAVASLPAYVYRPVERGRIEDTTNPINRLIRRGPNATQTWADFIEWLLASTLLRGNGLAEIIADDRGAVTGLQPIPWGWCSPVILPSGALAYDIVASNINGTNGRMRRLLADEVLHLRDRSDDGVLGRSRLSRAAEAVGAAMAVQQFAGSLMRNGLNPSGIFKTEGKLSMDARQSLRDAAKEISGSRNAAVSLVLDQGLDWKQISVSPEDAELLASRRFSTEELARIFQVPPPLVGIWDHSSFTNSETAGRWFAQHTLSPWLRKLESEFARSVFTSTSGSYIEFDLSGFLRGDPEARWRSWKIAIKNQVLVPNEVREAEGYNPRDGGDEFPAPAAPAPAPPPAPAPAAADA